MTRFITDTLENEQARDWMEQALRDIEASEEEYRAKWDMDFWKELKLLRIRRGQHGYPDMLIEGTVRETGDIYRGWFNEGESAQDIRWQEKTVDGWPEEVS